MFLLLKPALALISAAARMGIALWRVKTIRHVISGIVLWEAGPAMLSLLRQEFFAHRTANLTAKKLSEQEQDREFLLFMEWLSDTYDSEEIVNLTPSQRQHAYSAYLRAQR